MPLKSQDPVNELPAKEGGQSKNSGQGQWALIWREFRRHPRAVVSLCLILLLVTASVCAPFLANDRPIYYRGYNRFEYSQSLRTLGVVIRQLAQQKTDDTGKPVGVANPGEVIDRQIDVMAAAVNPETASDLQQLRQELHKHLQSNGNPETAKELSRIRVDLRRRFNAKQVEFISQSYWPAVATLTWLDLLFLTFNFLLFFVPAIMLLLGRTILRDRPRIRGRLSWGAFVLLPTCAALLWWCFVPERVDRTKYKAGVFNASAEGLESAPVVYDAVTWPLVPFALDEDNLDAKNAPPPFWPKELDEKQKTRLANSAGPWDQSHWLGTDDIGRDVLCRMIWGGRVSLSVGIVAVSIYVTIGIIVGAIAGYFRGTADLIISRIIEIVICFPSFFLILTVVAFIGPSIFNIMVVIGVIGWTGVARLVRGEFLRLGEQEFVLAARALGYSPWRIIFRHVLPNAMAPVLVSATFGVAGAILTESALSFLGFGVTIPTPSWGSILAAGRASIEIAPWMLTLPGIAIFLTITAYNLVGEAFRDAADPRLRGQHIHQ